jgi:hypothetical protein
VRVRGACAARALRDRARQWPWVQSGFLTLHSLVRRLLATGALNSPSAQVMIMKMHSYLTVNGYLQFVDAQAKKTRTALQSRVDAVGGWDAAVAAAQANRGAPEDKVPTDNGFFMPSAGAATLAPPAVASLSSESASTTAPGTPALEVPGPDGTTKTVIDAAAAATLRQRLVRAAAGGDRDDDGSRPAAARHVSFANPPPPAPTGHQPGAGSAPDSHPLGDHPDEGIATLARRLAEADSELVSSGPEYVRWPANVTWKNFVVYMLIPSLVYELEYPRTDRYVLPPSLAGDRVQVLTHAQDPAAVRVREDGRDVRHVRAAVHRHGELHPPTHADVGPILLPFAPRPCAAVHGCVPAALLPHLRCATNRVACINANVARRVHLQRVC